MTISAALYRPIAASCAAVAAFHGVLHETIGPVLFPWAPDLFGPLLWHGMGIAVLVLGSAVWAGVLDLIRFPIVPVSIAVICLALGVIAFILATHGQFHFLALCLAIAMGSAAYFHRRDVQTRQTTTQ